ncbi:MAG TPA: ABC transporter permease [Pyrinomonadaceae bacterium]|nr:ABC transporter permease [Pyrinomonadaceae bacterium]
MSTLLKDLRYGLRMMARTPAFTAVAILSLALGIGANATVFSLMDAVMLRALPVQHPDQIVLVGTGVPGEPTHTDFSYPLYTSLRDNNQAVSLIGYADTNFGIAAGDRTDRIHGEMVSANYFDVLGVAPAMGSAFAPSDEAPGAPRAAVISDALWTRLLGRDPAVLNKTIMLNGRNFSVVGVAPKQFSGLVRGMPTDVWITLPHNAEFEGAPQLLSTPTMSWLSIAGRLKPGVSVEQATSQLSTLIRSVSTDVEENAQWGVVLTPAAGGNSVYVEAFSSPLTLLFLAVVLILAIACANVASLLLARSKARGKEISVRLALGATRFRIVRQLLTEGLLLALAGGALGLLIAYWTSGLASALVNTASGALSFDVTPNTRVLGFTLLASIITVLFGVVPALKSSRVDLVPSLKDGNPSSPVFGRGPSLQSLLVVTQVSLSLILLTGAGLFVRTLWKLQSIDKGFAGQNVVAMSMNMGLQGFDSKRGANFYAAALQDLASVPGVEAVTLASSLPLTPGGSRMELPPNATKPAVNQSVAIDIVTVAPRFFETTRLPLVQGRDFRSIDTEKSTRVLVVNETMARTFWPNEEAVGRSFSDGRDTFEIVGVARDTKYRNLRETPRLTMYRPLAQAYVPSMNLVARTSGNPANAAPAIQQRMQASEPTLAVYNVRSLTDHVGRAVYVERMQSLTLGSLGVVALILTAIGIYGVIAYSVAQRTREIGIRIAVGAQRSDVFKMVLVKGLVLAAWGSVIGLVACYWLSRFISSQLYGVTPYDPITLVSVAVVLAAVALFASFVPARRATRVNPLVALRYE